MDHVLDHFFFWTFFLAILSEGSRPLALREGWDAIYQYSGMGGRQTVFTEGGLEDKILLRREGWEVVVLIMLLINGVFTGSYKLS